MNRTNATNLPATTPDTNTTVPCTPVFPCECVSVEVAKDVAMAVAVTVFIFLALMAYAFLRARETRRTLTEQRKVYAQNVQHQPRLH